LGLYGNVLGQKTKNIAVDSSQKVTKIQAYDTIYAYKKISKKILFIAYQKNSKEIDSTKRYIRKHFLWIPYKKEIIAAISPKDSILRRIDSIKIAQNKVILKLQEELVQDSLKKLVIRDTIKYSWYKPDAIRVGVDGSHFMKAIFSKSIGSYLGNRQAYEITTDLSFRDNRYFLLADIGYSNVRLLKSSRSEFGERQNGFQYDVQGAYFRVGIDYNVMRRFFNNEILFIGLRYGQSIFSHTLQYNLLPNDIWNIAIPNNVLGILGTMQQTNLTANWFELAGGLKVNIWKNFFTGYTIRLLFLGNISGGDKTITRSFDSDIIKKYQGTATINANEIPGYGNTEETVKLGFSFYAYYRFVLRKRPEVVLD
jgi:hypothetical protein